MGRAHQFLTYTTLPATQYAVAEGLAMPALMAEQHAKWAASREVLNRLLAEADFAVLPGAATWFSCIDLAASGITLGGREFSERAVREGMVATIPISAFLEPGEDSPIVRLCHCKDESVLAEGVARLAAFRRALG